MNKTELVAAIADRAELSKKDSEKALKAFAWEKSVDYLSSERCYQIIYEIEVQDGEEGK